MKNNKEGKCIQKLVTTLFYLRKTKTNRTTGLTPIYLRITLKGVRKEISVKRKIHSEIWDSKSQKAKGKSEEVKILNSYLQAKVSEVNKYYNSMILAEQQVCLELIIKKIKGISESDCTILQLYKRYISNFEQLVEIGKRKQTRLDKHNYNYNKLTAFILSKYKTKDISLSNVNLNFIVNYEYHLRSVDGNAHNTAVGYCKALKAVAKFGFVNEILAKHPFVEYSENFKDTPQEYLTNEELEKVENMSFKNTSLDKAKDFLLFCSYTGLAYIDVCNLSSKNLTLSVDGRAWLNLKRQKTDTPVSFPLLSPAIEILKKYNAFIDGQENLIPTFSNQDTNRKLKLIMAYCGINKRITTHSGRHTFATTVSLSNGVPLEIVSELLGHSSIRTTKTYAKIESKYLEQEVQKMENNYRSQKLLRLKDKQLQTAI
jgi:site-specific recombinase XerD